jgi:hypothetical protein
VKREIKLFQLTAKPTVSCEGSLVVYPRLRHSPGQVKGLEFAQVKAEGKPVRLRRKRNAAGSAFALYDPLADTPLC